MATLDDIRLRWQEALTRGDMTPIGAFFAEDGRYYAASGEVDTGPEAVVSGRQQEHDNMVKAAGGAPIEARIEKLERHELGDTAVEVGTYEVTAGGATVNEGSYIAIAGKVGGEWKVRHHMVTSKLPTPAQLEAQMAALA
jgi:ketosteroid isomerase-like protein